MMPKYYRLLDDVELPNRWYLGEVSSNGHPVLGLLDGKRMPGPADYRVNVSRRGTPLDFCLTSFAEPIVKLELAVAILQLAQQDLELLPVTIEGKQGRRILNILKWVDCLDEQRSEFTKWSVDDGRADLVGQYRNVNRLFIDESRIPASRHIFRLANYPVVLIVSEQMRTAMLNIGCYGAKFIELS